MILQASCTYIHTYNVHTYIHTYLCGYYEEYFEYKVAHVLMLHRNFELIQIKIEFFTNF